MQRATTRRGVAAKTVSRILRVQKPGVDKQKGEEAGSTDLQ